MNGHAGNSAEIFLAPLTHLMMVSMHTRTAGLDLGTVTESQAFELGLCSCFVPPEVEKRWHKRRWCRLDNAPHEAMLAATV